MTCMKSSDLDIKMSIEHSDETTVKRIIMAKNCAELMQ